VQERERRLSPSGHDGVEPPRTRCELAHPGLRQIKEARADAPLPIAGQYAAVRVEERAILPVGQDIGVADDQPVVDRDPCVHAEIGAEATPVSLDVDADRGGVVRRADVGPILLRDQRDDSVKVVGGTGTNGRCHRRA
jgi:hypothetical protein